MNHHIVVSIEGGVAQVCEEMVPHGIVVEILDFDNLEADQENVMAGWSPQLKECWMKNYKSWGRCSRACP